MYEELVKRLRAVAGGGREEKCDGCPYEEDYPCCVDCLDKLHKQAAAAFEELEGKYFVMKKSAEWLSEKVPRWIPMTERLPKHEYGESTSVLTVDLYGVMRVTYFDGGNWCWQTGEALTTMRVAPITHWMPLPEPPKEEET